MTNEQLYLYMQSILARLIDANTAVADLPDANQRDTTIVWVGEGPAPMLNVAQMLDVNFHLLDIPGYEERETGMNAAARIMNATIDAIAEEVERLIAHPIYLDQE